MPQRFAAFRAFSDAAFAEGALSKKTHCIRRLWRITPPRRNRVGSATGQEMSCEDGITTKTKMRVSHQTAPKFLNLSRIRFPIGAIASVGHRISGVLLLFCLPLLALALDRSLRSEADFEALRDLVAAPGRALLLVVVVWAAAHHLLAGIRHLLMDIGVGSRLDQARTSAWAAIVTALVIALAAAVRWWS